MRGVKGISPANKKGLSGRLRSQEGLQEKKYVATGGIDLINIFKFPEEGKQGHPYIFQEKAVTQIISKPNFTIRLHDSDLPIILSPYYLILR